MSKCCGCRRTDARQKDSQFEVRGAGTVGREDVRQLGSSPVVPTVFQKKPFGESVEGLSYLDSLPFSHMAPSSIRDDLERGIFARST